MGVGAASAGGRLIPPPPGKMLAGEGVVGAGRYSHPHLNPDHMSFFSGATSEEINIVRKNIIFLWKHLGKAYTLN